MSASAAPVFATDDSDLDLLLSQAKDALARKQEETQKEEERTRAASQAKSAKQNKGIAALSVPLRLDVGDNVSDSLFIKIDSKTGAAKLDLEKATKQDPTTQRKQAKERAEERASTAGKNWFGMKAPVLTQEIKNDLRVLQLRNVLDPKRFYKKNSGNTKVPKYFEMGTIIEGATEFYSGRLTKKERRNNLVDELLADKQARDYFKRKVDEIQAHNVSGGKGWYRANFKYDPKSKSKKLRK
ncbi:rrna-processing protein fcf2 [Dipsacomyces acuminosporus]|nr:rrna-processing protein fcf2 [Dipsacomyces acuminosporus]